MADKQGKTLRHRLSQFILFWVRCHVAWTSFFYVRSREWSSGPRFQLARRQRCSESQVAIIYFQLAMVNNAVNGI